MSSSARERFSLPTSQVWKSAAFTTAQTGTALWTPVAGKKIAITSIQAGCGGSISAKLILWFGAAGDTTYTAGTDQLVFAGSMAPILLSGIEPIILIMPSLAPILAETVDHILRITTDAALTVDLAVYGYEF